MPDFRVFAASKDRLGLRSLTVTAADHDEAARKAAEEHPTHGRIHVVAAADIRAYDVRRVATVEVVPR